MLIVIIVLCILVTLACVVGYIGIEERDNHINRLTNRINVLEKRIATGGYPNNKRR